MTSATPETPSPEMYHENAHPEKNSAKRLADSLEPWRNSVPAGPLLEVGAGTGIFTHHLRRLFPGREITITDASATMLESARSFLNGGESEEHDGERRELLSFSQLNTETDHIDEFKYSLICGSNVAHQFKNPAATLEKLALGLKIDGLMLMSFPGEDSFQEWRSACLDLGIPYTGKPMPGTEPLVIHLSMGPVQVDFYEDQSIRYFKNFEAFCSHMLAGGMQIEGGERQLTEKEIGLLNKNWKQTKEGAIGLTYHNVFMALKRIGE